MSEEEYVASQVLKALSEQVRTEYDETIMMLSHVLKENGVTLDDLENLMTRVPGMFQNALESTGNLDEVARTRASIKAMDAMYIGLMFHAYRRFFIEKVEGGDDDE